MIQYAMLFKLMNDMAAAAEAMPPRPPQPPAPSAALATGDNLADAGVAILSCYHHTAKYRRALIVQRPWTRQGEFGATRSLVIRIEYEGAMGQKHRMDAALMVRPSAVRSYVLNDANSIHWNKKCELERWVPVSSPGNTPG